MKIIKAKGIELSALLRARIEEDRRCWAAKVSRMAEQPGTGRLIKIETLKDLKFSTQKAQEKKTFENGSQSISPSLLVD